MTNLIQLHTELQLPRRLKNKMRREIIKEKARKKLYETEVQPLIQFGQYNEAFSLLSTDLKLKDYLSDSEVREMYNYVEKELIKLKGLEGKTK